MKITSKTKTKYILPLLDADRLKSLLDEVPAVPLEKTLLSMTIREFSDVLADEENFIKKILGHRKALTALGMLRSYREQAENIGKFMKMYDHKKTPEEEQAAKGVVFPDFAARMMADCVRFFHLKSFDEAEKCKVSDWLTIFQIEGSQNLFQRRFNDIINEKQKRKHKK